MPATYLDINLDINFPPKNPQFWNLMLELVPIGFLLSFFQNKVNFLCLKLCANLQHNKKIFFSQNYPQFWHLKLDFFPIENVFRRFSKIGKLFSPELYFYKKRKKIRKTFLTTKNSRFSNFKSDFFPIEKVFRRFSKLQQIYLL